jgi:hypothetical protein
MSPDSGLSADYVFSETRRERADLAGTQTLLWPRIDIDIPPATEISNSNPEGTRDAVLAAFKTGAEGVLLSRTYSEMKLANVRGADEAVQPGLA